MYRPIVRLYTSTCKVCKKIFKNEKSMKDHIFNKRVNDVEHIKYKNEIRELRFINAKLKCPVCEQKLFRTIGNHLKDSKHADFLEKQSRFFIEQFLSGKSVTEIINLPHIYTKEFSYKYVVDKITKFISNAEYKLNSKKLVSKKRVLYWKSIPLKERKKIMLKVRKAEWGNLNKEERKNHPWVIAGRKASLESSKKGSKNQVYAFKLLKEKFPNFNWKYNYCINENWQIDIAIPEKKLFIEWDGRYHFIPIHGKNSLNNRINRDKIKNNIITKELKGCLIRIKDEGRENKIFVEEKINQVSDIIKNNLQKGVLIQI